MERHKEQPLPKRNSIPDNKLVLFLFSLSLSFLHVTHGHSPDPTTIQELRIRNGLPNFFRKLASKKEVKVAYLGGSITKANGWRTKSFEWLEKQYPQVTFKQINAAIGGTNSDFGACRLDEYVLQYQPDLLFVEYRVNSGGNKPERAIEGIVRRTKAANPETDICFVYTLGEWMIETLAQGKQTWYGTKMEQIANHYGIPSIDYAPEVIGQLEKGVLSFNVQKREEGKLWFTKDRCHPTDEGHELYRDIIARSFVKLSTHHVGKQPYKEIPPLHENHYSNARFQPLSSVTRSNGWELVDPDSDTFYPKNKFRAGHMLGKEVIRTDKVGASFTVTWDGPHLGFTTIPHGGGTVIEVLVDGKNAQSFKIDGSKKYRGHTASRVYYLKDQDEGKHTATFTVKEVAKDAYFYVGQFMVLKPN